MKKRTILVIDDSPEVTKILKFHLEKKYTVLEARDGEAGLKLIYGASPDLVILDINMPRMDGLAVYNKLCADTGKISFPVIILTVREELGALFKDLNVDGFITKPFDVEQVLEEIEIIMDKRYGAAAPKTVDTDTGPKTILVVESNQNAFYKIAGAFSNAGYVIKSAKGGMEAIEKIMAEPPNLVLIKLELPDIAGDLVCVKLKRMPKTMDMPFVLYSAYGGAMDRSEVKKICSVINSEFIESDDPIVLLTAARDALRNKKK